MTWPTWLGVWALDDAALVALGNPGLLRRARGLAKSVRVVESGETVVVEVDAPGAPRVTLTAQGASGARCSCPVAGVCVHVIAACLWVREQGVAAPEASEAAASEAVAEPRDAAETAVQAATDSPVTSFDAAQSQVAASARSAIEGLVGHGLSRLDAHAADSLAALGQRARLEELPRLARLLQGAGGTVAALADRRVAASEAGTLDELARVWSLAVALSDAPTPELVGTRDGVPTDVGTLLTLSVRWQQGPDGSRGATGCFFDLERQRLEWASTGRAPGQDPGFRRGPNVPLLWGTSGGGLLAAPFRLEGAERLSDGTLNVTSRTQVAPGASELGAELLSEVALHLALAPRRADGVGFDEPAPRVGLVLVGPQGCGALGLDEVRQQVVWPVRDATGGVHRLRLPASHVGVDSLLRIVALELPIEAITVEDGVPTTVFVRQGKHLQGISLSLGVDVLMVVGRDLRDKLDALAEIPAVEVPEPALDPLAALLADVTDALTAVAASGGVEVEPHVGVLSERTRRADELGWGVLARALRGLLQDRTPASLMRASAVVGRLRALV